MHTSAKLLKVTNSSVIASLANEEVLAVVTPRLQVVPIVGVLDEAHGAIAHIQVVPADNCRGPFAVAAAPIQNGPVGLRGHRVTRTFDQRR